MLHETSNTCLQNNCLNLTQKLQKRKTEKFKQTINELILCRVNDTNLANKTELKCRNFTRQTCRIKPTTTPKFKAKYRKNV